MKGKKVFLVSSILAGIGLVGGTFAAWAVTDNANPFSVKITPGTLDIGDDKSVTLDWGTKGLVDIENLEMGVRKGPYEVGLIATTSDASAFTGNLSIALTSQSNAEEKLIDYLTVKVYEAAAGTGEAYITVPDAQENYTVTKDIVVTSGTEKKLYFFIELQAGISPLVYDNIKNDVVTLTVDWNKGSAIPVITSSTFYFNNSSSWSTVYAYAWNTTTGKTNAAWPGVAMTQEKGAIYSVAIPTEYTNVIFNDGTGGEGKQTADLTLPAVSAQTPYYNGSAWAAKPDLSKTSYYLVGTLNAWTTGSEWALVESAGTAGTFAYTYKIENVNCAAETELKVVSSDNLWYGEGGTSDQGNMVIHGAGAYDFYFNENGSGGVYIYCQAHV